MTGYLHVKDQPPNPKRMCRRGCIEYPDGQWALCAWHEGRAQWAATNTHRHDRASCPQCAALVRTPETPVADTAGIDAAWQQAVDLIPEGVKRAISIGQYPPDHEGAGDWVALVVYAPHFYGDGPTVAAALLALAAALRTPKPEGER